MDYVRAYPDEIAEKLIKLTKGDDKAKEALTEALYNIKAISENPHNKEYYRTLYYYLETLATVKCEIEIDFYDVTSDENPPKYQRHIKYFSGDTPKEAHDAYRDFTENHDLSKYTPTSICRIDTYNAI